MTTVSACPRCGTTISTGNKYCSECGADVTGPISNAPTTRMTPVGVERSLLERLQHATLGDFEVLRELGRGGMAMVYLAHDLSLNRKVAIKVMAPNMSGDASMAERFVREAQTAASLSHPNIIPVYSVKHHEDLTYFVMKFIPGRPLDDIMRELGPMPIDMVIAILQQVAGALGYGHKRGVVHRDVKPGNVMIDDEGWAIVTDFGIAKVDTAEGLTQTGAAIGTPAYMSPEQCTAKEVSGASDQYSLGVVAYEMITGSKPFEGDSVMSIMYGHVHEDFDEIRSKRPDCPESLSNAVKKMMAKDPSNRFAQMEDLITAVGATPLSHDDPIRTEMMTLAAEGISAKLMKQIVTPRSPIPLGREKTPKPTAPQSAPAASSVVAAESSNVSPRTGTLVGTPRKQDSKKGLLAAIGGVAIVAVAALVIIAPWNNGASVDAPSESLPVEPVQAPAQSPSGGPVARIGISPEAPVLDVGQSLVLSATAIGYDDAAVANTEIVWRSEDERIASVSTTGEVTAHAPGAVRLIASSGDTRTGVTVTVERPPPAAPATVQVASVSLNQDRLNLSLDETAQLRATPRSSTGAVVGGRPVAWTSSNPSVATVSPSGVVNAVGSGEATIVATVEGRRVNATVTVAPEAVASVTVSPASQTLQPGQTTSLSARLVGAGGNSLTGRPVTWESGNTSVASVTSDGTVTGVGAGTTTISAVAEGRRGSASISVEDAQPVGLSDSESRAQIETLINSWGAALESRNIGRLRAANPGMTADEERSWTEFFNLVQTLDAQLNITNISITGDNATAIVQARYVYSMRSGGDVQDVQLAANFALEGLQWRMRSIR